MQLLKTWFGIFKINEEDEVVECTLFPGEDLVGNYLKEVDMGPINDRGPTGPDLIHLAKSSGFVNSDDEYLARLHDFGIDLARHGIENSFTKDQLIVQAIKTLDDLDGIVNLLTERLVDWESIPLPNIDEDLIGSLAAGKIMMDENRVLLEDYIDENMRSVAPNVATLAGPLLGARLISIAGGLDSLSKMPSSTVQVLGAGKALFRHLQKGTPPPKHGIIFRHPLVHGAPRWQRGKIARVFASKLSIAARIDFYSGTLNEDLLVDLNHRVDGIRKAYPNPPKNR